MLSMPDWDDEPADDGSSTAHLQYCPEDEQSLIYTDPWEVICANCSAANPIGHALEGDGSCYRCGTGLYIPEDMEREYLYRDH